MIHFTEGNMFENTQADCFVNPVNCFGVMGAGLAKQFKQKFPSNFEKYVEDCKFAQMSIGVVTKYHDFLDAKPVYILQFSTKHHWKDPSTLAFIAKGMKNLRQRMDGLSNPHGICIPQLGCGLGGLDWKDVRPLILAELEKLQYPELWNVFIYGKEHD